MQLRSSLLFGLGICLSARHGSILPEENRGIPENWMELVSDRKTAEPLLELHRDHEAVLEECAHLMIIAKEMEHITTVDEKLARKAISCIQRLRSFLTDHQSREEAILIPIVRERFDSEVSAAVSKEHVQILELVRRLEEKIAPPGTGLNSNTDNSIPDLLTKFDSFVRAHFAREENVLFWFASLYIPQSGPEDSELSLQKSENHQ